MVRSYAQLAIDNTGSHCSKVRHAVFSSPMVGAGDGGIGTGAARQKSDLVWSRFTVMVRSGTFSQPSSAAVSLFSQMITWVG